MQIRWRKTVPGKKSPFTAAYSLVEVMVASVIGAIIFSALFYAINQSTMIIQYNRENLRATQILVGKIEGIRLCAWGDASGTNNTQLFNPGIVPPTFTDYFYPISLGGFATNSVTYTGTITVLATNFSFYNGTNSTLSSPPSYSNNIALVTVTVNWSTVHYGRTNAYSKTMKTFIARDGIQNYIYNN